MKNYRCSWDLPVLAPEDRILLLCARIRLDENHKESLRSNVLKIKDWSGLLAKTGPHRLASMTLSHLKECLGPAMPLGVEEPLKRQALLQVLGYLKIAAAQQRLNERVLADVDVPHLFFKGIGLAEEYYPFPGRRPCRDIDIWIDPEGIGEVWSRLAAMGYRRVEKADRTHEIPAHHAAHLLPTIDVLSPDGVLIEIHTRLDHSGLTINAEKFYKQSKLISTAIGALRVPCLEDHYAYICQHHTRHLWARLRWLVDLDAFEKHPHFDRRSVRKFAAGKALADTVAACFDLYDGLNDPELLEKPCASMEGSELKRSVLTASVSGPDQTNQAARDRKTPDFALPWQYSWWYVLRVKLRVLKPTQADYLSWPLDRKHWWLHYLMRPIRKLRSMFGSAPKSV